MADAFPLAVAGRIARRIVDQLRAFPQTHRDFLEISDPEQVHALRRALRRLAFIDKVAVGRQSRLTCSPSFKRANRWLGRLRDIDVLRRRLDRERVYTLATNVDDLLIAQLSQARSELAVKVVSKLETSPLGAVVAGVGLLLTWRLQAVEMERIEGKLRSLIVLQDCRLRRALARDAELDVHEQHHLRCRARGLRYAVELMEGGGASQIYLDRLTDIHSALGEAHDRHAGKHVIKQLLPAGQSSSLDFRPTLTAGALHRLSEQLPELPAILA